MLASAGFPAEAAAMFPEVAALSRRLGNDLDQVRLRWLEGRIAAALHDSDRAALLLGEVRSGFAARQIAYDAALVSLELAAVHAERKNPEQVKAIARSLVPILKAQEMHQEGIAALMVFRQAAEAQQASVELVRRVLEFLYRARYQAGLRFEE